METITWILYDLKPEEHPFLQSSLRWAVLVDVDEEGNFTGAALYGVQNTARN